MSRAFPHPNTSGGWTCAFCGTSADRPVLLVPVERDPEDDKLVRCEQVHEDCFKDWVSSVTGERS